MRTLGPGHQDEVLIKPTQTPRASRTSGHVAHWELDLGHFKAKRGLEFVLLLDWWSRGGWCHAGWIWKVVCFSWLHMKVRLQTPSEFYDLCSSFLLSAVIMLWHITVDLMTQGRILTHLDSGNLCHFKLFMNLNQSTFWILHSNCNKNIFTVFFYKADTHTSAWCRVNERVSRHK